MDPKLNLAAVILNRVAEQPARGRDPRGDRRRPPTCRSWGRFRAPEKLDLPSRHLGLVTVAEHPRSEEMLERAADLVEASVDVGALLKVAREAPRLEVAPESPRPASPASRVRIGVARDVAFSFYYPENLEELEQAGAELVFVSPTADETLPDVDAFYIGGGFPEVYAARLAENRPFRHELRRRIAEGLPGVGRVRRADVPGAAARDRWRLPADGGRAPDPRRADRPAAGPRLRGGARRFPEPVPRGRKRRSADTSSTTPA